MTGGCLPLELISDILSRLPSKILCRFKCVSKDFLFLITFDSQFKDLHRGRFSENPRLLQYEMSISDGLESKYKLSQTTFDLTSGQECDIFDLQVSKSPKQFGSFIRVTSCRELVCIYSDRQIVILNPTTHQFISLAVENKILPNTVGIGYVDSCNEYKVVLINRAIIRRLVHHDLGCQVYTLKDGSDGYTVSTKIFEGTPQDNFCNLGELLPICVDGVLYWMSVAYPATRKMVMYYLNLKDNSYGNFPLIERDKVESDEKGTLLAKFAELQGSLCIQCSSLRCKGFKVYALKDTKLGVWEEIYNIPYPPGIESRIYSPEETLIAFTFALRKSKEPISYRPAMSILVPHVLGFLPSNHSGIGVPDFVVSKYIDEETCRVYIVDNGTIKTSADIRFSPRKTCQLLYYEGLFSFKSL